MDRALPGRRVERATCACCWPRRGPSPCRGRERRRAATIARIEPLIGADTGPLPDGFSSAAASLATLQGIFSWGDFDLGYAQAVRATELEGPGSAWRPVVCWAMGLNLLFRGELDQADLWFVEATELAPARGQWLVACAGLAYRSLIAGQSGHLELQAQLAEQAIRRRA